MGTFYTIIIGIIAGIILATPPGIINLAILNCLGQDKKRRAFWIGAGSATLDVVYAALAMYSASAIYVSLFSFIKGHPGLMLGLEIVFIMAILAFGVSKVFVRKGKSSFAKKVEVPKTYRKLHPYLIGCMMALTHIIVPTFLPAYAYMAAVLLDSHIIPANNFHYILFAVMFGLGNLIWVIGIISFYGRIKDKLDDRHFRKFDKGLGILFLVVGCLMAGRLIFR